MSGLTEEGLEIPTLLELKARILGDIRATVDPAIGDGPNVIETNEIAPVASATREVYEVAQQLFDALDPDNAEGALLENLSAITGTYRLGAVKSSFLGTRRVSMTVGANKTIPAGQIISQLGHPEIRAVTLDDAVNATAIQANVLVRAEAETAGPIEMPAGTMTVRVTSATGWVGVTNPEDATIGRDIESYASLRIRRFRELAGQGSGNVDSIRADVLKIKLDDGSQPILECLVLENDRDVYSTELGLPPHSIEVIVWDGAGAATPNSLIADAIFAKTQGATLVGSIVSSHTDSYGFGHEIRFSRVTQRALKIELSYKRDALTYVGDTAAAAALSGATQTGYQSIEGFPFRPGGTAEWSAFAAVAKDQGGVKAISLVRLAWVGDAFSASFNDKKIGFREIITLSADDVVLIDA